MKPIVMSVFVAGILVGCATAQTPPSEPEAPATSSLTPVAGPCDSAPYHAFDFWLGHWDVTDRAGTPQGSNIISREENGCLLIERWTSVAGNTGQSYNFYNPDTDKWRQVWVSSGAIIDYSGGLTEEGAMKLEGHISPRPGTPSLPFTGEWTLNEDGSVTQHFEQYDPEADVWNVWFTGIYRKKEG